MFDSASTGGNTGKRVERLTLSLSARLGGWSESTKTCIEWSELTSTLNCRPSVGGVATETSLGQIGHRRSADNSRT